jgi:hypothetical protein
MPNLLKSYFNHQHHTHTPHKPHTPTLVPTPVVLVTTRADFFRVLDHATRAHPNLIEDETAILAVAPGFFRWAVVIELQAKGARQRTDPIFAARVEVVVVIKVAFAAILRLHGLGFQPELLGRVVVFGFYVDIRVVHVLVRLRQNHVPLHRTRGTNPVSPAAAYGNVVDALEDRLLRECIDVSELRLSKLRDSGLFGLLAERRLTLLGLLDEICRGFDRRVSRESLKDRVVISGHSMER